MPPGRSLRQKQWDKLDEYVRAGFAEGLTEIQKERLRGAVEGLSWSIFLMDHPYWVCVEDIYKEAAKRFRIHQGQEEYSPTPGCDEPWHPAVLAARDAQTSPPSRRGGELNTTVHPLDKTIRALGQAKIDAIMRALAANFDQKSLADVYGIPVQAVVRIAAQPGRFAESSG